MKTRYNQIALYYDVIEIISDAPSVAGAGQDMSKHVQMMQGMMEGLIESSQMKKWLFILTGRVYMHALESNRSEHEQKSAALTIKDYIHAHAMKEGGASEIKFMTRFPDKGLYKLWCQFNREGRILTADFWINIER